MTERIPRKGIVIVFPKLCVSEKSKEQSEFYFDQGLELEATDRKEAEKHYRISLEHNPNNTWTLVNLGALLMELGKKREAVRLFKRAITVKPDYALALFNLATCYDNWFNPNLSIHYYERAIAANPQYADPHFNLASHYVYDFPLLAVKHFKLFIQHNGKEDEFTKIARSEIQEMQRIILRKQPARARSTHYYIEFKSLA